MHSLEALYEKLSRMVPTDENSHLTLSPANCPCPPGDLATDRLKVEAWPLGHSYGDSARYDTIHFFADAATYRAFGLLLFSLVFHPNTRVTLHLKYPQNTVTRLVAETTMANPADPSLQGLVFAPVAFGYWPSPLKTRHPLAHGKGRVVGSELPFFELTNEQGMCVTEQDFATRSVVMGFGNMWATLTLACLLLDMGCQQTSEQEFNLESPSGYQGVPAGSAEARFTLGYDYYMG